MTGRKKVVNVSESFGRYTITTTSEINNKLEADRIYFCAGLIPNTEFMRRNFAKTLDEKNQIKVNQNFRVEGTSNIYALGDCNNTPELKTAFVASLQSNYFIKIFKKLTLNKKVSNYEFAQSPPPAFILSLGPFRGVFAAAGKVLSTGALAVTAKNQIMNIGITKMNQDKSLLKIDYDKILTKDLKNPAKKEQNDSDEEEGQATLKRVEQEFGFH